MSARERTADGEHRDSQQVEQVVQAGQAIWFHAEIPAGACGDPYLDAGIAGILLNALSKNTQLRVVLKRTGAHLGARSLNAGLS
jgi:hypothetical protein